MKKPLLLAGIIAWALVLVIVVVIVAVNVRGGEWQWDSEAQLLKDEQAELSPDMHLTVKADSMDIELLAGEGEQLLIRQYGKDERHVFSIFADNNSVVVETRPHRGFGFFSGMRQERLEIEIPASWLGDVSVTLSSGRLYVQDAFTWQDVDLTSSSGGIIFGQQLTAANLRMSSSSGSIRALAELNIDGDCSLEANSGSIHLDEALYARELFGHSSSGNINLAAATVQQFELSSSSGSILAVGLSGSGSCRVNSGSIDINLLKPLGDTSLQASSGRINVSVPSDLAFIFEGRCSSGNIHTDFPVDERDKGKLFSGSVGANPDVSIEAEVNSGNIHISRD